MGHVYCGGVHVGQVVLIWSILFTILPRFETRKLSLTIGVTSEWMLPLQDYIKSERSHAKIKLISLPEPKTDATIYDNVHKIEDEIVKHSIQTVIGPLHSAIAIVTEKLRLPYMSITSHHIVNRYDSVVEMMPRVTEFCRTFADLIYKYKWKKLGVFYDDDFDRHTGVALLEQLMTNHDLTIKTWSITQQTESQAIRDFLIQMRKVWIQKVVLFCRKDHIKEVLEQARSLAMVSTPYEWAFFDPDGQYLDAFALFEDVITNFTILSLLPFNVTPRSYTNARQNDLYYSLVTDSLQMLIKAAHPIRGQLSKANATTGGALLMTQLLQTDLLGKTGVIQFDQDGQRTNVTVLITEISGEDVYPIGEWKSHPGDILPGLTIWPRGRHRNVSTRFPLKGRTVQVVTILEKPFTMLKRDHQLRYGNDRYKGFAIDLITEIGKMLDFSFEIYMVNDGKFGAKIENGEWNGMIGELLAGNATLSVASLSINSEREEAVDFTKPFMTRYITVLMRTPKSESSYFEFLNPLSPVVWLCTFASFIAVSAVLYLLERLGDTGNKEYKRISFKESFWFIFGSLLQGNTDSSPNTVSGRILTSAWWFFALILISSYTANLAAFLTVKKINTPIKSVTDLAQQTKIKYGTVKDSGVMSFFKNSNIEHFAKMWAQMSEVDPSAMVHHTEEGYRKVKDESYAFFWDTTVNKYKTIEDCEFTEIGPPFDAKGFGIGVPPGATYREELSMAILRLSDTGKLYEMENKWWGSSNCPDQSKGSPDETSELQIDNVAGVFFIVIGGVILAAIMCAIEKLLFILRGTFRADKNRVKEDKRSRDGFL